MKRPDPEKQNIKSKIQSCSKLNSPASNVQVNNQSRRSDISALSIREALHVPRKLHQIVGQGTQI